MNDRYEEVFMSYVNGQSSQWKRQLRALKRADRANCISYIRQERDEDVVAHRMALWIIQGAKL